MRPLTQFFQGRFIPNVSRISRANNSNHYNGGWNRKKHPSSQSAEYTTATTMKRIDAASFGAAMITITAAASAAASFSVDENLPPSSCCCLDMSKNKGNYGYCPYCTAGYGYWSNSQQQQQQQQHYQQQTWKQQQRQRFDGSSYGMIRTRCDDEDSAAIGLYLIEDFQDWDNMSEPERFLDSVKYHRSMLSDYKKRWIEQPETPSADWPLDIPKSLREVSALEFDLTFCEQAAAAAAAANGDNSSSSRVRKQQQQQQQQPTNSSTRIQPSDSHKNKKMKISCQHLKFRIASYYLLRDQNVLRQKKGYKLIKQLAEQGHADAMCLYGMILNEGQVAGIDANPKLAVKWWKRCMDLYRHIPSMYEYSLALYTGEGVPEDTLLAVKQFVKAANLGHPGAAFMLGECLLDGVGVKRDRGSALEWLVDAAELGHRNAQIRVISVLETNYDNYRLSANDEYVKQQRQEESIKWEADDESSERKGEARLSLERRMSIGGGSRNPVILERRKSIVRDSREK